MSHFITNDTEYQKQKKIDENFTDPKWCAIKELEERIQSLETQRKTETNPKKAPSKAKNADDKDHQKLPPPGQWIRKLQGTLTEDPEKTEVNTTRGPTTVVNAQLETVHGVVKLGLWGDKGDALMQYTKGDKVSIRNLQVKDEWHGIPQLNSGKYTRILPVED